ncbi:MAG: hypothetical protein IK023_06345 [Bacteroidaceae bacterium]|nr:hypothetical protein [Bacteroidaceae bacterium]
MKKFFSLLSIALIAMIGFSACNTDDENEARVLSGEWEGDWGMFYDYQYDNGAIDRFYASNTYIKLTPDHSNATHGTGIQEDYYRSGPYKYRWFKFNWEVRDGVIYLTYPHDHELDVDIYDYQLSNDYFTGYFGDSNSRFRMSKLTDFYYWTPAVYIDSYYGYTLYDYLYSNKYEGTAKSKDFKAEGKVIKNGRDLTHGGEK